MVFKAHGMDLITREGSKPQFQLTLMRQTSIHGNHKYLISYRLQNYEKSSTYANNMLKNTCF